MMIRINCKYNDSGAWCKHKKVKRSLFGIGARCCTLYPYSFDSTCKFQEEFPRPKIVPPCPPRKKENESILVIQIKH